MIGMDDRTRQMIEAYLPHPRDPALERGAYYYRQETSGGERVIRVYPLDILPHRDGMDGFFIARMRRKGV